MASKRTTASHGILSEGLAPCGHTHVSIICRDLSRPVDEPYLRSGDLGQLLVACLEGRQLPEQMRDTIYQGMQDDLVQRGKVIVTEQDSHATTCRWVKLAIHRELENWCL